MSEFKPKIANVEQINGELSFSLSGDDVKVSERLYIHGRKLRGFESGRIGPKSRYASKFNSTLSYRFRPSIGDVSSPWKGRPILHARSRRQGKRIPCSHRSTDK